MAYNGGGRSKSRQRRKNLINSLLLAAVLWVLFFRVNRFTLEIRPVEEMSQFLEYGSVYYEPQMEVALVGTAFSNDGIVMPWLNPKISGDVDEKTLGRYQIVYTANFLGWRAKLACQINVIDTKPPVITLTDDPDEELKNRIPYNEAGFTAIDNYDGDITHKVVRTEGYGRITYAVTDSSGNPTVVYRRIPEYDFEPPIISLKDSDITLTAGTPYKEPGYSAHDNVDGYISSKVKVTGAVDCFTPGTYTITYSVRDSHKNSSTAIRKVTVIDEADQESVQQG